MTATLTYDEHILAKNRNRDEATSSPVSSLRAIPRSSRGRKVGRVYTYRILRDAYQTWDQTSNCIFALTDDKEESVQPSTTMPSISFQVSTIIEAFSLTISQAARVLAITRPTVYAWRKSEDSCNAERTDHQRLMKIYDLATEWQSFGLGPMGDRNLMPFEDDRKSVIGYLSGDELTDELLKKISDRMKVIAKPKEHPGLLATRGTNWREAFRKMGIAGPTPEQQDAIQDDNLTRLRREY